MLLKNITEQAWTAGGNLNTARDNLAAAGTQTVGLAFGGNTGANTAVANTEQYDGSAWSNTTNMGTARRHSLAGAGTLQAGLGFGGYTTTSVASTEEFTSSINVTTPAAWASGGNLGTARYLLAGAGTQTAGLAFGGINGTGTTLYSATEEYDGSAWTGGGNMGTARRSLAGAGIQTAGLVFGGDASIDGTGNSTATEEYDGSAWTGGGNMGTARRFLAGCGLQTAGLAFGGYTTTAVANTEEYDGSAWTGGGNLATARASLAGCGLQTAGLAFGGFTTVNFTNTEEYDGTSWISRRKFRNSSKKFSRSRNSNIQL
jgi:hypothetical protein